MPEATFQPAAEIGGFLDAIFNRYGYDLHGYAPSSLRRRVRAAVSKFGLSDVGELQRKSVADPYFFGTVLTTLTVHVTEMFRDPAFYLAFRRQVVPILRTYPYFSVWHGGCATGEEAYSLAILLAEEGLAGRCQIYATDVNPHSVEHAKLGIYRDEAVATFAANYRAAGGRRDPGCYLTRAYGRVSISEQLRRSILFFQHDLVGDHAVGQMHVIFCRNVMIYFGQPLKEQVTAKLGARLHPLGFLCLGKSEQLARPSRASFVEFSVPHRIYRRVS